MRLSEDEPQTLHQVIRKLAGSSMKVRRAQMLLKADINGPAWNDQVVALAIVESIRYQTVRRLLKNGMTQHKIAYWVIPPKADGAFAACVQTYWQPMKNRMVCSIRWQPHTP